MTIFRNGGYVQGTTQNFTTSSTSQYSNVVGPTTGLIRIATTQNTWITIANASFTNGNISANVVAYSGNSMLLPANVVGLFATNPSITQVAFLQVTTSGSISITELA